MGIKERLPSLELVQDPVMSARCNLPKDPRESLRYQLQELIEHFSGNPCTSDLKSVIRAHLLSIYQSYVTDGIFPFELWDLDHRVEVSFSGSTMNVLIPYWISHWVDTGEFMTVEEVKQYLGDER